MRMQSILVRPYVLDCLSRYEDEAKAKNPELQKPKVGFFAKREQEAALRTEKEEELEEEHSEEEEARDVVEAGEGNANEEECDKTVIVRCGMSVAYESNSQRIELPCF